MRDFSRSSGQAELIFGPKGLGRPIPEGPGVFDMLDLVENHQGVGHRPDPLNIPPQEAVGGEDNVALGQGLVKSAVPW